MNYSVCIPAAGKGVRTRLSYNKVFYALDDQTTVLDKSLDLFLSDPECVQVVIACSKEDLCEMERYRKDQRVSLVIGGATRQESVYRALQKVTADFVFIHDGARPYVSRASIEQLKETLKTERACLLMIPSVDTVKVVKDGYVKETLNRSELFCAQTPQCFETKLILHCHEQAGKDRRIGTDDAQLVEWYAHVPVKVVPGEDRNVKITTPKDLK